MSGMLNDKGQSFCYKKAGEAIVNGNEDGIKHSSMTILYALQHLGYTIPPQADCGWIGEAGPGPSYGDESDDSPIGFDNEFTQRNTTIMTWNLHHMARMLKDTGGLLSALGWPIAAVSSKLVPSMYTAATPHSTTVITVLLSANHDSPFGLSSE
ncbi:MAG: hypothetical protein ACJAYC_000658 [Halieaceae bacterium]|jgi:hypothetical protein